jgi:hypothetical protein
LLAANDRLAQATQGTSQHWPYVTQCWIDQMSEPTEALAAARLKEEIPSEGIA